MTDRSYVVVGTDGSPHAANAVSWAADEAQRRQLPLRIVTVFEKWAETHPRSMEVHADQEKQAAALLTESRAAALARHPELQVDTILRAGEVSGALATEAQQAALLVTGTRGRGGFAGMLLGSTSLDLTAGSPVPLIVVPGAQAPSTGPIVVGVDGSEASDRALAFAVDQARSRQVGLVAVQVLTEPQWFSPGEVYGPMVHEVIDVVEKGLEEQLGPVRAEHPDLPLTSFVEPGHPAEVLRRASDGAQLLVVGSRGRSMSRSTLLGSISHGVLHHAPCPVAVLK